MQLQPILTCIFILDAQGCKSEYDIPVLRSIRGTVDIAGAEDLQECSFRPTASQEIFEKLHTSTKKNPGNSERQF